MSSPNLRDAAERLVDPEDEELNNDDAGLITRNAPTSETTTSSKRAVGGAAAAAATSRDVDEGEDALLSSLEDQRERMTRPSFVVPSSPSAASSNGYASLSATDSAPAPSYFSRFPTSVSSNKLWYTCFSRFAFLTRDQCAGLTFFFGLGILMTTIASAYTRLSYENKPTHSNFGCDVKLSPPPRLQSHGWKGVVRRPSTRHGALARAAHQDASRLLFLGGAKEQ